MATLRDRFERSLRADCLTPSGIVINGSDAARLPDTSSVAFRGLDRQQLLIALDLAGIACSAGSACASGSSEPSPVLLAMGLDRDVVTSTLRFSLGAQTTESEIDLAARRIAAVCRGLTERR
jgi:cysteine desulfurase